MLVLVARPPRAGRVSVVSSFHTQLSTGLTLIVFKDLVTSTSQRKSSPSTLLNDILPRVYGSSSFCSRSRRAMIQTIFQCFATTSLSAGPVATTSVSSRICIVLLSLPSADPLRSRRFRCTRRGTSSSCWLKRLHSFMRCVSSTQVSQSLDRP